MKYAVAKMLAVIAGFCIILGMLAAVICGCATDAAFYHREYEKLHVADSIGITDEELKTATDVLLSYTKGEREDMLVYAEFDGQARPVFNERETAHMQDVRALFLGARCAAWWMLGGGALLMVAAVVFAKQKSAPFCGYLLANYLVIGLFAALALYAAIDFTSFWTSFHRVFFTNDLWLLDPATDNLILMVPEQFFSDLVCKIVAIFLGAAAALYAAGAWMKRRLKQKQRK